MWGFTCINSEWNSYSFDYRFFLVKQEKKDIPIAIELLPFKGAIYLFMSSWGPKLVKSTY